MGKANIGSSPSATWKRLIGLLKEQKEDCARMISSEMGKLITEAEAEVEKCMALCSYVLDHATGCTRR